MSKVKMRCARCSKPFKSSDSKQTLCPDCLAKERLARARGATQAPGRVAQPAKAPAPAPIIVQAPPPPDTGAFGPAARRAEEDRRHQAHAPAPHAGPGDSQPRHETPGAAQHTEPAPRHGPHDGSPRAGTATKTAFPKPQRAPRPPKPPKEPVVQAPRELTDAEREQVEQLYLKLAQPREYDGIRTQIATQLGLPKTLVRKAVLTVRAQRGIPSWWELQAFPGSAADLERIRAAYEPLLPVPPVGVHKQIAEQLGIEPHAVYKGIRQLRAQMGLPQFNPPEQHPEHGMTGTIRPAGADEPANATQDTGA